MTNQEVTDEIIYLVNEGRDPVYNDARRDYLMELLSKLTPPQ